MSARDAVIVGVAESDLGSTPGQSPLTLIAQASARALADAGLTPRDVDGLAVAGADWHRTPPVVLAEYLGLQPRWTDGTNVGGASFEFHVHHAMAALQAGACETVLITYGSTQRSERSRRFGGRDTRWGLQYEAPYGIPQPLGAYALAAQRHMSTFGTTPEQLAEVAVAARSWAAMNEKAMQRQALTIEDVLASPMIASPLHRLDCCLVTDGGGAVVLTTAERAAGLRQPGVRVLGAAEVNTHEHVHQMRDLTRTGAAITGPAALAMAGLEIGDIDVAQLYDSFTITVLLLLEDLGFCAKGEAGAFVADGRLRRGGALPTNTSGGGLSYCHPGMFGIFLIIEAVRQLRGESGPRQVPNARTALVHGVGNQLSSHSTLVLGSGE